MLLHRPILWVVLASLVHLKIFIIWKGRSGKTTVHPGSCPFFAWPQRKRTTYPILTWLAAGTINNYMAKLKSLYLSLVFTISIDNQSSSLLVRNPASHLSVSVSPGICSPFGKNKAGHDPFESIWQNFGVVPHFLQHPYYQHTTLTLMQLLVIYTLVF